MLVDRRSDNILWYPAMRNRRSCVNLWTLSKTKWQQRHRKARAYILSYADMVAIHSPGFPPVYNLLLSGCLGSQHLYKPPTICRWPNWTVEVVRNQSSLQNWQHVHLPTLSTQPQCKSPFFHAHGLQVQHSVLSIGISIGLSNCAPLPSAARLVICIYIDSVQYIAHAMIWYSKFYYCNNDEYDWWKDMWLWQSENNYSENATPSSKFSNDQCSNHFSLLWSLPQYCAERLSCS